MSKLSILILGLAILLFEPTHAYTITIPTLPVGNPGNAADPLTGNLRGSVSYDYRIGTTEVTNAQYAAFLNAKASSDPLALYNTNMSLSPGGITRSGASGSYSYATIAGRENMPVTYVSWYDAIRFANWLNNGQGAADTESGAYTLLGGTPTPSNGSSVTRNSGATWVLTSENEWYKAAYHQPADQGGDSDNYWLFPTASNQSPIAVAPPGGSNSANFSLVTGDLTVVGAYVASHSPYGTFDQGGNALEWNELLVSGALRRVRGSSFFADGLYLRSDALNQINPATESLSLGFRVATVPEPSAAMLSMFAVVALAVYSWRRRMAEQIK